MTQLTLKVMVSKLEAGVDDTEQYSRRANVRLQGIHDIGTGEEARVKVLQVINETMKMRRCLWLGRHDPARPRTMIVRFNTELTRDSVYLSTAHRLNANMTG